MPNHLILAYEQDGLKGFVRKLVSLVENGNDAVIEKFPVVAIWEQQFLTDWGSHMLALGQAKLAGVLANPSTFLTAAQEMVTEGVADGVTTGEQDALAVAANALRTHVEAAKAATVAPVADPEPVAPAPDPQAAG